MPHYSQEFKEKLIREMMSPAGRRVSEIHRDTGISENTLYSWKNKYGGGQEVESGRAVKPENWDGERKLLVLTETAGLNEQELSEYCREDGLYVEHLNADLVNPSRAPISLDVLERFTHKFRGDSTSQRINFTFQPH
uniref:Transposase n=1 Tax=Candidatus Kentrum sp. UNK TaxID=2126344 RepID=A0A451B4S9_9GAMM|nr:MAG: Transposase [Candidatus Kentron sp. UNK]VFK73292.1 MAG: Transposase [Candidatus Kentron sp. UNK]